MRRLVISLVLLSVPALAQPAAAGAQVYVDPDSPAGKEYAIPLDEARKHAQGGSGESLGGVAPSLSGNKGGDKSGGKGKDSKKKGDKKGDRKKGKLDSSGSLDTSGSTGGGGGGSSGGPDEADANGALLTSGVALAVLLLGGGIAFLMRRGAFGTDA